MASERNDKKQTQNNNNVQQHVGHLRVKFARQNEEYSMPVYGHIAGKRCMFFRQHAHELPFANSNCELFLTASMSRRRLRSIVSLISGQFRGYLE